MLNLRQHEATTLVYKSYHVQLRTLGEEVKVLPEKS